jgi:dynein light chain roadblock-type
MSDIEATPQANGHVRTASIPDVRDNAQLPPEIESTLARLSAYRNVRGVMILTRGSAAAGIAAGVVQSNGSVFEGESGKKYARVVEGLVASVEGAVAEVDEGVRSALHDHREQRC